MIVSKIFLQFPLCISDIRMPQQTFSGMHWLPDCIEKSKLSLIETHVKNSHLLEQLAIVIAIFYRKLALFS